MTNIRNVLTKHNIDAKGKPQRGEKPRKIVEVSLPLGYPKFNLIYLRSVEVLFCLAVELDILLSPSTC